MASIQNIKGSDGSGNASTATVQSTRSALASTIVVDTVAGINADGFSGSMGTPHVFVDPVTAETIVVISEATAVDFTGHVDGSNLEIDTIAPGYTDNGSAIGDIVIIRPTTQWSDTLAEVLEVAHRDDGTLKPAVIYDSNGNEEIKFIATGSAVNEITIANAATGNGPAIAATGGDTNIDINLNPKGTGQLKVGGNPVNTDDWDDWTPTFANFNKGNAVIYAKYNQVGKRVDFQLQVVLGSTSSMGTQATFTLPVTSATLPTIASGAPTIGLSRIEDNGIRGYNGVVEWITTTTALLAYFVVNSNTIVQSATTASAPMTWGVGDAFWCEGTYPAA